jgi:hypothetical protein
MVVLAVLIALLILPPWNDPVIFLIHGCPYGRGGRNEEKTSHPRTDSGSLTGGRSHTQMLKFEHGRDRHTR